MTKYIQQLKIAHINTKQHKTEKNKTQHKKNYKVQINIYDSKKNNENKNIAITQHKKILKVIHNNVNQYKQ